MNIAEFLQTTTFHIYSYANVEGGQRRRLFALVYLITSPGRFVLGASRCRRKRVCDAEKGWRERLERVGRER